MDSFEMGFFYRAFFCGRLRQSLTALATAVGSPRSDQPVEDVIAATNFMKSDLEPVDTFLPIVVQARIID
jgi:hypothetical protein